MKKLSLFFSFFLLVGVSFGQKAISGMIKDVKGEALIGANVVVRGTTVGTITDFDGAFSLSVPNDAQALEITYTGYETQIVSLDGSSNYNITMSEGKLLDEVVVTALGIKRDKKALGYGATTIGADDVARKPETDVARALAGRAPGINIVSSAGLAGSGTKVNIRGTSTISGSSQPLWIVDGVPINTSSNENNDFRDGNVAPTRNLDIDPNNIASMTVLKGLSATTLYGSQGRNGVILVTTKTGSGQAGSKYYGSVSQSYNTINAFIPEYQNKWANGFDGDYGEFFSNWGVLFANNSVQARHPYFEWRALFPENPEFAQPYTPTAQPTNVSDFFQTGQSLTTAVNAGVNGDLGTFNIALSKTGESGYIKNNNLDRLNLSVGGQANITKKLKVNTNFSYIKTDFETPPVSAGLGSNPDGGPSVFGNLFYTPRDIDLTNWPNTDPVTGGPVYYRNNNSITNPYWLLDNAASKSNVNRFLTNLSATYNILENLGLTYRLGIDNFTDNASYHVNKGSVGYPSAVQAFGTGLYRTTVANNTIQDHSVIVNFNKDLNSDFDLTLNAGVNGRKDDFNQTGLESTGQIVFGLLSHRNFSVNSQRTVRNSNLNYLRSQILLGAFADATVGYKNYLYVNVQGRNDWSSAHQKGNNSLFYPGVSISFIPTDAFPGLSNSVLDYLKLRVGRGTSANFATPYRTVNSLLINTQLTQDALGFVVGLNENSLLANPDLRPELQTEVEGGIESKLFKNRVSIDLSLYSREAKDQIIERPLDPSTGFTSTFINAGTISNRGVELAFGVTPVKTKDFSWDLRANFTKNVSLVKSLPEGSGRINISGYSDLGNFAIEGEPYGVIVGSYVVRNDNGDLLVNENGDYVLSSDAKIIGDPNPDYMLSGFSDVSWKGITLGGQLDFVKGGDIFSYSAATPIGRGVAKELEDFNPETPVILPGVSQETGEVNNIPMPASGLFFGNTIIGGGANDRGIYDATRLRLRELSLTYKVPAKVFGGSFIKGLNVALTGNNLWYRSFNTPKSSKVDPDRTAFGTDNGFGFDFLGGPSARRMGINVKLDF